jgi:hypothetical protein
MKFDIQNLSDKQFVVNQHIRNGKAIYLVQPHPCFHEWTQENKIFRSSVWDSDGVLISAGFPKFVNWGEKPGEFPTPTDLRGTKILEKLDGSLLICSKHEGDFILRTRGTVDAYQLANGEELDIFKRKYLNTLPNIIPWKDDSWNFSLLFEWLSPKQRIVLNYGDTPDWYLVGAVNHDDYSLWTQSELNDLAKLCLWARPLIFEFNSLEDLLKHVEALKGMEGVCLYSPIRNKPDQAIHKIKSTWYLTLHRMKTELASREKVIDVWMLLNRPSYNEFYDYLAQKFDFELANQVRGEISKICDAKKEVDDIIAGMKRFVDVELSKYPTRKLQAVTTFQSYGKNTNRAGFVFTLLDGKELSNEDYKKLLFQCLKK